MYCGSEKITSRKFLEPGGFAVDLGYEPHNDSSKMKFMPVVPPRLNINKGDWVFTANRRAGRIRYSADGSILHRNPGRENSGYSICLRCGRAAEQKADGCIAEIFTKPHYRLRGGKDMDGKSICEASNEDHSIVIDYEFAFQSNTSVAELQLNDPQSGEPLADEKVAWSLAVALRQGLVQSIGLEAKEVGIAVQSTLSESGKETQSLFFYDQTSGGAGYSEVILHDLPEILDKAIEMLRCSNQCDGACHGCLLSYDTQHKVELLDRFAALQFIDKGLPALLRLEPSSCYFGDNSKLEALPFDLALAAALGRTDSVSFDLFLTGTGSEWELHEWDFLNTLVRYGSTGLKIRLAIKEAVFEELTDRQVRMLAALTQLRGFNLFLFKKLPPLKKNGMALAMVSGARSSIGWASHSKSQLQPGSDWVSSLDTVVRGEISEEYFNSNVEAIREDQFEKSTTVNSGSARLTIFDELNGSVSMFAEKFWNLIFEHAPDLRQQLEQAGAATKIVYTDKYIKSPLACRLLAEFVMGLPVTVVGSDTAFNINTVELKNEYGRERTPRLVVHDWNVDSHRRGAINSLFSQLGWAGGATDVRELRNVPHYRELQIYWPGEKKWTVQFDHGFGCWIPTMNESFPFQQSVANQGSTAGRMDPKIRTRNENFKNYVFVDSALM